MWKPLDPGDAPAVTARDVVDRSTLKTFVNEAADYFQELYETEGYDGLVRVKRVFRDTTGYWRHGPIYLFGIDRTGYVFFHGAFPEKFELQTLTNTLRDAVTGDLILPQIIAAAASSEEGGFVEYHFDNPDDDTDSAEILKVTYALERENTFTLPDSTQRTLITIMGAGIYEPGVTSVEPVGGKSPRPSRWTRTIRTRSIPPRRSSFRSTVRRPLRLRSMTCSAARCACS